LTTSSSSTLQLADFRFEHLSNVFHAVGIEVAEADAVGVGPTGVGVPDEAGEAWSDDFGGDEFVRGKCFAAQRTTRDLVGLTVHNKSPRLRPSRLPLSFLHLLLYCSRSNSPSMNRLGDINRRAAIIARRWCPRSSRARSRNKWACIRNFQVE
jgi:hypothetical protein